MTEPSALLVYRIDQLRAHVTQITDAVREHQQVCDGASLRACCGGPVLDVLRSLDRHALTQLLIVALVELATTTPAPSDSPEGTPAP